MANSVYLDEVAHIEPSHPDLRCLQIQLFSSPVVKELKHPYLLTIYWLFIRDYFNFFGV